MKTLRRPFAALLRLPAAPPILAAALALVVFLPGPSAGAAEAAPGSAAASEATRSGVDVPAAPEGFSVAGGSAERGAAVYAKRCAICHGESGDGNGRVKAKPAPRDLRNGAYMSTRSDWEIYLVIRDGGPAVGMSKTMLPWKSLSDQDLDDLVAFIRSLAQE